MYCFILTDNYREADQFISDYTTGMSAADIPHNYSSVDPASKGLPEKRKSKRKLYSSSSASEDNYEPDVSSSDGNLFQ